MELTELKSIIEALLFTWGDPLDISEISNIVQISVDSLQLVMEELMDDYADESRGLRVIRMGSKYQIATKPEHYEYIKKLSYSNVRKSLSNAALETLSIIAYKQPIIKSEIDHIRGVKCDRALETLLSREMIAEVGRLDRPGKPIVYGTTNLFLRAFSLESLDNLPDIENIDIKLEEFEEE